MSREQEPRHRRESIVFEPELAEGSLLVEGYGKGYFKVAGRRIESAVLVQARSVTSVYAATMDEMAQLDPADWFDADKPELIFVGTGTAMQMIPKSMRDTFTAAGIALEPMDTGAAARTYNVLLIEGRRVAALMLPNA